MSQAVIFDIQRGSMVDGPGVRTTVFVKGCPLRCAWCHNPEAIKNEPQTVNTSSGRQRTYGKTMTAEEVFVIVSKDKAFYECSGGGLTISGGEPMFSFDFTLELARLAHNAGIHVCLDSTGFGTKAQWQSISEFVDLFLFDFKHYDPEKHKFYTGVDRVVLINNISSLAQCGARIRLRCPIIPEVNDDPRHFQAIREFALSIPNLDGVDLLPYHDTGRYKNDEIGRVVDFSFTTPSEAAIESWKNAVGVDLLKA